MHLQKSKAKRFASSLGCLKSASGHFGFNSFEDDIVIKSIYKKIEIITENLNDLTNNEIIFAKELVKYCIKQIVIQYMVIYVTSL